MNCQKSYFPTFWAHKHTLHLRLKDKLFQKEMLPFMPERVDSSVLMVYFSTERLALKFNIPLLSPHPSRTSMTRCILLSFVASKIAILHSTELCCTLLSYAAPYWAILHLTEPYCTFLSYGAPYWDMLHPIYLCCTLLSYAAPYWALLHSIWA